MALIEEALVTLVTTDVGLQSVGVTTLYPLVIQEDAKLPAICYQETTTEPGHTHNGASLHVTVHVQFTIEADTTPAVKKAAKALRKLLDGYKGTVNDMQIGGILWENEYDGYSEQSEITTVRQDYQISYHEE
jgi:hypothetical protein